MWNKLIAFIILLSHMNTSMFIYEGAEQDMYTSMGTQINDINSVVEFIDQKILGHKDGHQEDEDDDNGQNLHLAKVDTYCYTPFYTLKETSKPVLPPRPPFSGFLVQKTQNIPSEIIAPPPDVLG